MREMRCLVLWREIKKMVGKGKVYVLQYYEGRNLKAWYRLRICKTGWIEGEFGRGTCPSAEGKGMTFICIVETCGKAKMERITFDC
jgi:hypothetical protein